MKNSRTGFSLSVWLWPCERKPDRLKPVLLEHTPKFDIPSEARNDEVFSWKD